MFRSSYCFREKRRSVMRLLGILCLGLLLLSFVACSPDGVTPGETGRTTEAETVPAPEGDSETGDVADTAQPSNGETTASPEGEADTFGDIEEILAAYHDPDGRTMSCAHRAIVSLATDLPENSLAAVRACIEAGVDILEIDVKRTKDGEYVLCHDAGINRCTTYTGSKTVPEMTYAEIRRYALREYTGLERAIYRGPDGKTEHVPTFAEVLALVKDECMINFDQFYSLWDYRMELYALVEEAGCLPNVIFKGSHSIDQLKQWQAEIRQAYGEDAVMPLYSVLYSTSNPDEYMNLVRRYAAAGVANCIETTFSTFDVCIADGTYMAGVRSHLRTFADVLTDSLGGDGFCAGMHEDILGWIGAERCGYNVIQTNNAADCAAYIRRKYGPRDTAATEKIAALAADGFDTPLADPDLAVVGERLAVTGDVTLSFGRVDFGAEANGALILCLSTTQPTGRVTVFTAADPQTVLAATDLSVFCESPTAVSLPLSFVPTGVQELRVRFAGIEDGQTILFDFFLVSDAGLGHMVEYEEIYLLSPEGRVPALPSKLVGLTDQGYFVSTSVRWAEIPADCYQSAPAIFTVPGEAASKAVSARVEIVPFDPADVLVWFQAGQGMELDENGRIIRWTDRVRGVEAVSAGNGSRPAFEGGQVVFDGVDDFLTFDTAILGRQELTVMLGSQNSQSTKQYNSAFQFNNGPRHALLMFPETGGWGSVWFSSFTDAVSCRFGTGADGNRGFVYTDVKLDRWAVSAAVKDGMNEDLYLDGACVYRRAEDTGHRYCTPGMGETIANTASYAYIGLGIQSSERYFYRGTASDILLFSKALSAEEIARVSAYLAGLHDGTLTINE